MGEAFETTGRSTLSFLVEGTAAIARITIVRNEQNHHVIEPGSRTVRAEWTDDAPVQGENRYYLRIEQNDGNMAWSSPLWVTVKP
jgi:hypothetical protein